MAMTKHNFKDTFVRGQDYPTRSILSESDYNIAVELMDKGYVIFTLARYRDKIVESEKSFQASFAVTDNRDYQTFSAKIFVPKSESVVMAMTHRTDMKYLLVPGWLAAKFRNSLIQKWLENVDSYANGKSWRLDWKDGHADLILESNTWCQLQNC